MPHPHVAQVCVQVPQADPGHFSDTRSGTKPPAWPWEPRGQKVWGEQEKLRAIPKMSGESQSAELSVNLHQLCAHRSVTA